MKYTMSVLVENHPGTLSKVSGLFSRRGYYRAVPQMDPVKKAQGRHGRIFTFVGKVMEDQQLGFSFV